MTIATWKLPFGKSAVSSADFEDRKKHYNFNVVNKLNSGQRVIPCDQTIKHIFDSSDMFGLEVAISSDSYIVINESDIIGNFTPNPDLK